MSNPLTVALGDYPHTRGLRAGDIATFLTLRFPDIKPVNRAFAPMVRDNAFDVCEMAVATFLQARSQGKRLIMLPVVMAARFQQGALLCMAGSDIHGPRDLIGRRIAVRAYSQTTGLWLRGIMAEQDGVRPEMLRWITFEDAHVAEYRDPPWVERAPAGMDPLAMLRAGRADAVIVGNDLPDASDLRSVYANPARSIDAFWTRHQLVPVNHVVTVRRELAEDQPEAVAELMRLFREVNALHPPAADGRNPFPFGRQALAPAVSLAARFAVEQGLLSRPLTEAEIWDGAPEA